MPTTAGSAATAMSCAARDTAFVHSAHHTGMLLVDGGERSRRDRCDDEHQAQTETPTAGNTSTRYVDSGPMRSMPAAVMSGPIVSGSDG